MGQSGSSGFKGGKYAAKNEMLWAWVDDNKEWSKGLIEEWSAFTQKINKGEEGKWISIGRLICLVGEEEATKLSAWLPILRRKSRDQWSWPQNEPVWATGDKCEKQASLNIMGGRDEG